MTVVIAAPDGPAAARLAAARGAWTYLGKDAATRARLAAIAGPPLPLGDRVHVALRGLRQPFLDSVAAMGLADGRRQWWGTTASWKVWGASDFFLLLGYFRVALDLVAEGTSSGRPRIVVVEDPWLRRALKRVLPGTVPVEGASVWRLKIRLAGLGLLRRGAWLWETCRGWWRQRRASRGRAAGTPGTVALYSVPMPRAIDGAEGWRDPFLADLDQVLAAKGFDVRRFGPPEVGGFETEVAARSRYFVPLIAVLRPIDVMAALATWWRPRTPWPAVAGLDARVLAAREWWTDVARANWCRYDVFYRAARRLFAAGRWQWAVYPCEGQPWEKMLVAAAREAGVRTAAVQHSTLSLDYLSYFLGRDEARVVPLPDAVLASGAYAHRVLTEGGYPPGRVHLSGSLRYRHLAHAASLTPGPPTSVLVALPIDRPMAEHLIAALAQGFPDGGASDGVRFHVRMHPSTPVDLGLFRFQAEVLAGPLDDSLRRCGTVVYVGTTLGPEAAAQGLRAVRYRPDALVDVDVAEPLADRLPSAGDADLPEAIRTVVRAASPAMPDRADILAAMFSPVDDGVLGHVFGSPS